ncbi:MAG TPA: tetratricopeptide repeat protein, partial [Vicinamibacterales bacterium]|nr:tetratricopeptide repeat protein [Vicinamibacterales bacterium]
ASIAGNPRAAVLRARAAIARGRHERAIELLTPIAASDDDAALELALLWQRQGKTKDARPLLTRLVSRADVGDERALYRAARAAHALGQVERANELFRAATALAGHDPDIQTAWGELLLQTHNAADAAQSFRAALQWNRRHAPAFVGLARALLDEEPESARQLAGRAIILNPAYVPGFVFMAELALMDRNHDAAREAITRALEVDPTNLEARALEAAIAWLEDRPEAFERLAAGILAVNPSYGEVFRIAGVQAARHYRFDDAVALARRGLAIDPDSPGAMADLGMHLLRIGREDEARQVLEKAFRLDPYDAVTYNLLGLLDTLETFVTIEDGLVTLRLHPDEAPVLREHALPLAHEALRTVGARYGWTPDRPILIEIFPRHDDFAVRNLGLPGMVGALGACFGRVVTLDSPRARPPGSFNWQATLWHELAHVVTLHLSKQRVPRWLTEGVSVYEERQARPAWARDMEIDFAEAMNRGEVIPLQELNGAFARAESIGMAYYQASLVAEHIIDRWGHDGMRRLLVAYGEGLDDDAAMQRALGTTLAELDASFTRAVDERFAPIRTSLEWPDEAFTGRGALEELKALADAHPRSFPILMLLADALERAGAVDEALDVYERAAALVPATGDDGPLAKAASLAEKAGNPDRAAAAYERLLAIDGDDIEAARRLAALLDPERDRDRWLRAQARIAELDPFDSAAHTALGRAALAASDYENAIRWLRVATVTGPRDPVSAHCDLADAYLAAGARDDAKRQTLAALEIAPTYARAQDLLLAIVDGRP